MNTVQMWTAENQEIELLNQNQIFGVFQGAVDFLKKNQQKITYFGNAMYKMIIHTILWQNAIFVTGI